MMRVLWTLLIATASLGPACSDSRPRFNGDAALLPDATIGDAAVDATVDGEAPDGAVDGAVDAQVDAATDATVDATPTPDAMVDAMVDATVDAGSCGVAGTYGVTPDPMNSDLCSLVSIASCTVTEGAVVGLTCGAVMADCNIDAMCRICTGSATIMGISGTVSVDFVSNTATVTAMAVTCDYSLSGPT
ncbi:MAG: hypothetical protein AAGF12_11345 [Myxococcota bacterium]